MLWNSALIGVVSMGVVVAVKRLPETHLAKDVSTRAAVVFAVKQVESAAATLSRVGWGIGRV